MDGWMDGGDWREGYRHYDLFPQFTIVLQCVEEVFQEHLKSSAALGLNPVSCVHGRHTECCHNTVQSQFSLSIPLSVTQSFQTTTGT